MSAAGSGAGGKAGGHTGNGQAAHSGSSNAEAGEGGTPGPEPENGGHGAGPSAGGEGGNESGGAGAENGASGGENGGTRSTAGRGGNAGGNSGGSNAGSGGSNAGSGGSNAGSGGSSAGSGGSSTGTGGSNAGSGGSNAGSGGSSAGSGGSSAGSGGTGAVPNCDSPDPGPYGLVNSDDFESGTPDGTWVVDNSSKESGSFAAHPPNLAAASTASLNYDCGGSAHSQLSFWYQGYNPAAGQNLNFYVDGTLYRTFGQSPGNGFTHIVVTVPTGTHAYRWDATTAPTVAAQPPYWVDNIQCQHVKTACSSTGEFDFEEGFVPPEVTGQWVIDNSSVQGGTEAAHPPLMAANSVSSLDFACGGKTVSQLSFWYQGYNPAAGQNLNFYVDNVLYHTYGQSPGNGFTHVVLTVPTGTHLFRWDATTAPTVAGQPPYWLDSIQCVNVPIAANPTGEFDFEEGFVPQEVSGTWTIDNSSVQAGAEATHPPLMAANATSSLNLACGGKTVSQLSFWYQGYNPAAGQNLNFYVDNVLYHTYGQSPGNGFTRVIVTVPTGTHQFRWDATTAPTVAGQPPYWLDSIQCVNVPPTGNTTGEFDFEEGFVPPEMSGTWTIDNSSVQAGSEAAHPPLMTANATSSLNFACGDKTVSQLSFWYQGYNPAAGQNLNFYVDNVLYHSYGQSPGNGFTHVVITVPTGTHHFRWDATTAPTVAGQPPYWVDTVQCINTPITPNTTGEFDFEESFVPNEVTGTWSIDNSSVQGGTEATHPPLMPANATSSFNFACGGKTVSQLSFWYQGYNPVAGQNLNFYVDNVLYHTYGQSPGNGFTHVVLTLPTNVHQFRWDATTASTSAGQPPYWIDTIQCINVPVTPNTTGAYNFEEGFVPSELTGTWQIDNSSVQAGSEAAHPPLLGANGTASLVFSCGGKAHTQISFYYQGYNPAAGQNLNFYIDGSLYKTYGQSPGNGFTQVIVPSLSNTTHSYHWDATTAPTTAGEPPYWIDSIACQ
jgi:hypothetical protein